MSTTENFTVRKGLPYLIKARAAGKWDYTQRQVFTTEGQAVNVSMTAYDGLSMDYEESYHSADRVDFSNTVLPWKWEYSTDLSTSRYCLMPVGTTYQNIIGLDYNYNFDVVGSPTINNETEVVSGFSSSNYIQTKTPFNPGDNSYEIKFKVSLGSTVSNSDFFGSDSGAYGLWFGIYKSKIYCSGGNGSTSSWVVDGGTYTVSANKTYYVKFTFTGTQYVLAVSEDDVTYINSYSLTSSTKLVFPSPNITKVGCSTRTNFGFSGGSIDLSESYIKINGSDWWVPDFRSFENLPGCTYNFTDTGASTTLNAFVVNGNESIILTPDNSYTNGTLLGTVSIPAHTTYTYDNGIWTEIE